MYTACLKTLAVMILLSISAAGQFRFDSWTTDNGLPQNSVYWIAQTPDGYLWLTTLDGLARFDGVKFTIFNKSNSEGLPTNRFTSLFADTDGTIWLGTEETGLVRFRQGKARTFTLADGLPSMQVLQIQKDPDGSLLILTTGGLARLRDGHFTLTREGDYRDYRIYIAPSGIRWELDKDGIRRVEKDGTTTRFDLPFDPGKISAERTYNYFFLVPTLEDREGSLWFAASGNLFRLKDGLVTTFTARDGMPGSLVQELIPDGSGAIWLGTLLDGVCRFAENRFACFGTDQGLSSNNVLSLLVDRENSLWVGTNERGINRVAPRVIESVSTAEGLAGKNVYPILESRDGGVWIGSFTGLAHYKDGKITNHKREQGGLIYDVVQSLFEDEDGRLWIGSFGGVQYLENGKVYDFAETLGVYLQDYNFWDIHRDSDGVLWFATSKGLIRYQNGVRTIYTDANGLPSANTRIVHEARDGSLWLSCTTGLAVMSVDFRRGLVGSETDIKAGITFIGEEDGLPATHIRTIYQDAEGTFWFGSYDDGLARFKGGRFTVYSTKNGLHSDGVFQILEDERGNFWMSSNQGIYRASKAQLNDFADGKIPAITSVAYGKSDGMLNIEANGGKPSGIKRSDGKLWFPTQDGVAIIDPEAVPFNPLPPPVVIEDVLIEQKPTNRSDGGVIVEAGQGDLQINYAGLSFIKPEQVRFKYKLDGLDENWTDAANRRTAYYPYLPPGKYVFRVMAANSDNVWSEKSAEIGIEVLPPFYRTFWFSALGVLAAAAMIYILYRRRIAQLQKQQRVQQAFSRQLIASQEQERKRIASELHDSLGQRLVVIKNLALMFLNANNGKQASSNQIEAISSEASHAIGEVKEISYYLRPYQLDRIGLTKAIEAIVRSARAASTIDFDAEIDDVDDFFPRESEINFYRIVQECVNNTIRHSEASEALIKVVRTEDTIDLEISDNGVGFVPFQTESKSGGFGLFGIVERVELFAGKVDFKSAPGQGTQVRISLKKQQD